MLCSVGDECGVGDPVWAPRQKWMPEPKALCRVGRRSSRRVPGASKWSSPRSAEDQSSWVWVSAAWPWSGVNPLARTMAVVVS